MLRLRVVLDRAPEELLERRGLRWEMLLRTLIFVRSECLRILEKPSRAWGLLTRKTRRCVFV